MTQRKPFKNFQLNSQPISRQIADRIQQMVMDGELLPGDRLPSERQLAEDLQVSRNMIREAVALLEERGIVSVFTGSGIYVTEVDTEAVTRTLSLYAQRKQVTIGQMFEVRWALEVENARLAAKNATQKNIDHLEAAIIEMEANKANLDKFTAADIRFHHLLARASQNPLFPLLLDTITDMLIKQAEMASESLEAKENALRHHRNIFQAICERDLEKAHNAMASHLESAWIHLLRSVQDPQAPIGMLRLLSSELTTE